MSVTFSSKILKYLTLILALVFFAVFSSCRDYVTDIVDTTPPEITTDASDYVLGDTVLATFKNNSASTIYVTGVYNTVERKNSSSWDVYSIVMCNGGCPEFPVYGKSSIHERSAAVKDDGIYRLVCAYSTKTGETYERKNKVYSNEFTVHPR